MLQVTTALIQWLPRLFEWALAPGAFVLLLLALGRTARPLSALGLMIIATISATFLSIDMAAIIYVSWKYGQIALHLLLNFGTAAGVNFLKTLLHGTNIKAIDFVPMIATTAGSTIAAVILFGAHKTEAGLAGATAREI